MKSEMIIMDALEWMFDNRPFFIAVLVVIYILAVLQDRKDRNDGGD